MSLHFSVALGLVAAAACLAVAGSNNRVPGQEAASASRLTSQSPRLDLRCNSKTDGVHVSLDRCNETGKAILKITVKDEYKLVVPKATESSSLQQISETITATSRTTPTTADEAIYHHSRESTTAEYEEYTYEDEIESTDPSTDEWDYLEEQTGYEPLLRKVLKKEKHRHPPATDSTPLFIPHHHGPSEDFSAFCADAAIEDEEPVIVLDGSFHPKYEEVPGVGVYRLHAAPRSWAAARRACEREGAQLAVPNSRQEALALADIHNRCPRLLRSHFNDYQYLGAHDEYGEGNWETVVGHPLNETGYVNWAFNQPDNAHVHGENCLTMNRNSFFNDVPCWTELPFICEHV